MSKKDKYTDYICPKCKKVVGLLTLEKEYKFARAICTSCGRKMVPEKNY